VYSQSLEIGISTGLEKPILKALRMSVSQILKALRIAVSERFSKP
jgi:hypothetical protein